MSLCSGWQLLTDSAKSRVSIIHVCCRRPNYAQLPFYCQRERERERERERDWKMAFRGLQMLVRLTECSFTIGQTASGEDDKDDREDNDEENGWWCPIEMNIKREKREGEGERERKERSLLFPIILTLLSSYSLPHTWLPILDHQHLHSGHHLQLIKDERKRQD